MDRRLTGDRDVEQENYRGHKVPWRTLLVRCVWLPGLRRRFPCTPFAPLLRQSLGRVRGLPWLLHIGLPTRDTVESREEAGSRTTG